jgi:hypothetical protein
MPVALRLDGKPTAATTTRRKRAVFANALGYASELGLQPASPLDRNQWKASAVGETVDHRSVASPAQAGMLLKAVRGCTHLPLWGRGRGTGCSRRVPGAFGRPDMARSS